MMDHRWPSDQVGAERDWIEYVIPATEGQVDDAGDKDNSPRMYRVDVSFMLSRWKCIFGQGCPGVLITGAMYDRGCCQIGVTVDLDEYEKLDGLVNELTEEDLDADLLQEVKANGWSYPEYQMVQDTDVPTRNKRRKRRKELTNHHTRTIDGACVLANRKSGSLGKPGCSLHRLAIRQGVHHSETKPEICWSIPLGVSEEYDEDRQMLVVTVTGTAGHIWGHHRTDDTHTPGWWCVESPEAYSADDVVYRTNEYELRKLMGDVPYETMVLQLAQVGNRRVKMPGEVKGRRIPLMVANRVRQWVDEGKTDELNRSKEVMDDAADGITDMLFKNMEL